MIDKAKFSEYFRYVQKVFMKNQCNLLILYSSGYFFIHVDNSSIKHKNDNNMENPIKNWSSKQFYFFRL